MMSLDETKAARPKEVLHDTTPSQITDHAFEPRGEWWTLCKHCPLARAAHRDPGRDPIRYYSDDNPDDEE